MFKQLQFQQRQLLIKLQEVTLAVHDLEMIKTASDNFLFSLNQRKKYVCKNPNYSMYGNAVHGPYFGMNPDFAIAYRAYNSYCTFAVQGTCKSNLSRKNSQKNSTDFSGAINGSKIFLKQWEVFKIAFQQQKNK